MFTGIVQVVGIVCRLDDQPPGQRLVITWPGLAAPLDAGESVSVGGCCLTVIACEGHNLHFDAGPETLSRTTLGRLAPGSRVNLERAARAGDLIGGHVVTGHVDGLGHLESRDDQGTWSTCRFTAPAALTRQMASKGSITVDGVSLTLVEVQRTGFSVALIPHTLQVTTLGSLAVGEPVNLETDVLAKYVEAQFRAMRDESFPEGTR